MLKKLIISLIISLSFILPNITNAKIDITKIYNNFITRIEKKNSWEKEIILLENIGKTFEKILEKNKKIL